jgi:hypothetical protein
MTSQVPAPASLAGNVAWSVQHFAAFWANPDPQLVRYAVTEDVVGYWPWSDTPVRGVEQYTQRIAEVLDLVPDLRLEVAEHASNGEFVFIRWIARGTGANGPVEVSGIDRIRLREGRVAENIIRFDTAQFHALVGKKPGWAYSPSQ